MTTRSGSAAFSAAGSAATAEGSARPKCGSETWANLRSGAVGAHVVLDEVDDGLRGGAGREDLGHAELLELRDVLVGDRASDGHEDVPGVLLLEEVDDLRHERHVRAGEDRQADGVGVLLQRGLDDLLRRLVQAGVDDLHPCVAQRAGDDLRPAIVPVEPGLGDDDADLPLLGHGADSTLTPRLRGLTLNVGWEACLDARLPRSCWPRVGSGRRRWGPPFRTTR